MTYVIHVTFFQGPNSDTEELLKNEETAENGNVTSSSRDGKGKKKKKYLGRIQYKAITLSVWMRSQSRVLKVITKTLLPLLSGGI